MENISIDPVLVKTATDTVPKPDDIIALKDETQIPIETNMKNILLPSGWVLYLYDKALFRKNVSKQNFHADPYREVCKISTLNDLIYLIQFMKVKVPNSPPSNVTSSPPVSGSGSRSGPPLQDRRNLNPNKINLDMNDYIIMREGIQPIWEDPKNKNGGTFSVKIDHKKGYDLWICFMAYIIGETLTPDMQYINGISMSYIADGVEQGSSGSTFLKIWDGKVDRTLQQFVHTLPTDIREKMGDMVRYTFHNEKPDFDHPNIVSKMHNKQPDSRRGGFRTHKPPRGRK